MKNINWAKEGYVCEQHPDKVFEHDGCIGPGMVKRSAPVLVYDHRGTHESTKKSSGSATYKITKSV